MFMLPVIMFNTAHLKSAYSGNFVYDLQSNCISPIFFFSEIINIWQHVELLKPPEYLHRHLIHWQLNALFNFKCKNVPLDFCLRASHVLYSLLGMQHFQLNNQSINTPKNLHLQWYKLFKKQGYSAFEEAVTSSHYS